MIMILILIQLILPLLYNRITNTLYIHSAMAEERKFVFSKLYKICVLFVIIIAFIVMPVYPEMFLRLILGIILAAGVFFGFGSNEAHCEYVYKHIKIKIGILKINWSLGCRPRMFAMLLSIGFYIFAVFVGFKCRLI